MGEPGVDETIITKFVVDIGEGIKNSQQLRADINKTKDDILKLSRETKESFAVTAEVLKKTFREALSAQAINEFGEISKDTLKQITAQVTQFNTVVSIALRELSNETAIITNTNKQNAINQAEVDKISQQTLKEKIAAQKEYITAVTSGKTVMSDAARQEGKSLEELAAKIKTIAQETKQSYQEIVQGMVSSGQINVPTGNNVLSLLNAGKPAAQGFASALSGLSSVALRLFGIFSAYQVLTKVVDYFKQAADSAYEFTKAVFALNEGVKVLQRSGIDITINDVYNNLDKLQKKFGIFSQKELVQGSASLMNLIRDFGLTKDQIFKLQDAIATLAVINGRSMDDVQRTVALALSSGYTEGLQRLGVSINRVTIAQEAARLGYAKNYMALTEVQRAQATYNLILEKTKKYQDDLKEYQNTAPGKIDSLKASFADLGKALGGFFLPLLGNLADKLKGVVNWLISAIDKAKEFQKTVANLPGFPSFIANAWGLKESPDQDEINTKKAMEERFRIAQGVVEKNNEDIANLADELGSELLDIESTWNDKRDQAWERYEQEKEDIATRYSRKLEDIELQLQQKLADLDKEYARKRADAYTEYQNKLADIDIWYQQAVQDANEKYHQQQLDEEKDFQREMERLRMQFLFDLEDAVQERNARTILNLIRKYNFDREEAQKQHEDKLKDDRDAYQRELADLKRQLAEKRKQARIDYQRSLDDLNEAKQREYDAIQLWYKREREDAELQRQRDLDDAKTNRDRMLKDADTYYKKQIALMAQKMSQQVLLQHGYLENLRKDLEAYIGDKGVLTELWKAYYDYMKGQTPQSQPLPSTMPDTYLHQAEGGTVYATRPTVALFGERGPEYATFTPVSKMGSGGGKVVVAVALSPDLEGRIINNALDEFANIAVEVYKESVI